MSNNSVITTAGLNFITQASPHGPLIAVKYFIPVYDYRIDPEIRTHVLSAISAVANDTVGRNYPFGERLWNLGYQCYKLSDETSYQYIFSGLSEMDNGSNVITNSQQTVGPVPINLLNDGTELSPVYRGTLVSTSAIGTWVITNKEAINGNTSASALAEDMYQVIDYYPVMESGQTIMKGNFRIRLSEDIGSIKYNKISLYAIQVDSKGIEQGNPVFFGEAYLNSPIKKSTFGNGYNETIIDCQLSFENYQISSWSDIFYGSTSGYWSQVPKGLHTSEKISIGNWSNLNAEPSACVHIGRVKYWNTNTSAYEYDDIPHIQLDNNDDINPNTWSKITMKLLSASSDNYSTSLEIGMEAAYDSLQSDPNYLYNSIIPDGNGRYSIGKRDRKFFNMYLTNEIGIGEGKTSDSDAVKISYLNGIVTNDLSVEIEKPSSGYKSGMFKGGDVCSNNDTHMFIYSNLTSGFSENYERMIMGEKIEDLSTINAEWSNSFYVFKLICKSWLNSSLIVSANFEDYDTLKSMLNAATSASSYDATWLADIMTKILNTAKADVTANSITKSIYPLKNASVVYNSVLKRFFIKCSKKDAFYLHNVLMYVSDNIMLTLGFYNAADFVYYGPDNIDPFYIDDQWVKDYKVFDNDLTLYSGLYNITNSLSQFSYKSFRWINSLFNTDASTPTNRNLFCISKMMSQNEVQGNPDFTDSLINNIFAANSFVTIGARGGIVLDGFVELKNSFYEQYPGTGIDYGNRGIIFTKGNNAILGLYAGVKPAYNGDVVAECSRVAYFKNYFFDTIGYNQIKGGIVELVGRKIRIYGDIVPMEDDYNNLKLYNGIFNIGTSDNKYNEVYSKSIRIDPTVFNEDVEEYTYIQGLEVRGLYNTGAGGIRNTYLVPRKSTGYTSPYARTDLTYENIYIGENTNRISYLYANEIKTKYLTVDSNSTVVMFGTLQATNIKATSTLTANNLTILDYLTVSPDATVLINGNTILDTLSVSTATITTMAGDVHFSNHIMMTPSDYTQKIRFKVITGVTANSPGGTYYNTYLNSYHIVGAYGVIYTTDGDHPGVRVIGNYYRNQANGAENYEYSHNPYISNMYFSNSLSNSLLYINNLLHENVRSKVFRVIIFYNEDLL
jgi:hypothetical protein